MNIHLFLTFLGLIGIACKVMGKQRVFVHFDDERNDILRFNVDSSTWSSPGGQACTEGQSTGLLSSLKDIYAFVEKNVEKISSGFDLELFDSKSGQFTVVGLDEESFNEDRFSGFKMLRVLVRCHSTGTESGELVAIGGRKFGNNPLVIGGRKVVINELHNSDSAEAGAGVDGDTGLQCWDSAFVLSKFLEKHKDRYVVGKSILEIGSGTGIVSIVCQLLTEQPVGQPAGTVGPAHPGVVTVTDLPYTMTLIEANIRANAVAGGSGSRIEARVLDWNKPAQLLVPETATDSGERLVGDNSVPPTARPYYDVLLCSDVIWLEHLIPALVDTLAYYGSGGEEGRAQSEPPVILIAHQVGR